jgi:NapH/MauN family ferredoxin-type protein
MSVQSRSIGSSSSVKPRLRGARRLLTHQTLRKVIQASFAFFILFVIVRHVVIGEDSGIVTASAEAYCPFGGLETLYNYVISAGGTISHTHLSNVVMLVAVLITALLLRSAFCGWVCPLGFIQDLVSSLSRWLQKRSLTLRKAMRSLKERSAKLAVLDRWLRYFKYVVLIWAVAGAGYYGVMVFRDYDPWSALINIVEFSFTPGLVVLIVTLLASFFVERPWCRYACPLGAASSLVGKLSPVYLKREESNCTLCKVCTKACPMGLEVHTADKITSADCISCLECVGACPRNGALEVKVGLPLMWK